MPQWFCVKYIKVHPHHTATMILCKIYKISSLPYNIFSTVSSKTSAAFPIFITDNAVLISLYVGSGISSCVANSVSISIS